MPQASDRKHKTVTNLKKAQGLLAGIIVMLEEAMRLKNSKKKQRPIENFLRTIEMYT